MENSQGGQDCACHSLADLTDIPDLKLDSGLEAYVPGGLYRATMQKWDKRTPGNLQVGDKAPEASVWLLSDPENKFGRGARTTMERVNVLEHFHREGRMLVLNFGSYS